MPTEKMSLLDAIASALEYLDLAHGHGEDCDPEVAEVMDRLAAALNDSAQVKALEDLK